MLAIPPEVPMWTASLPATNAEHEANWAFRFAMSVLHSVAETHSKGNRPTGSCVSIRTYLCNKSGHSTLERSIDMTRKKTLSILLVLAMVGVFCIGEAFSQEGRGRRSGDRAARMAEWRARMAERLK